MAPAPQTDSRYVFLDWLRALAAWLVVWDHLANVMPFNSGRYLPLAHWVRNNITGPLGIIQDFGWFGVAVFFLISGFIISDRAAVESPYRFVVRRVLRIYPMMAAAVAVSLAVGSAWPAPNLTQILLGISLANYLIVPQIVVVGVAWTLIIEVTFYAITALTQFMRASPHRIAINLGLAAVVIQTRGMFGPSYALFATNMSYLPVLVMGQIVYWWLARGRLSAPIGMAYLAAAFGVFLFGLRAINTQFLPVTNSYLISVIYALGLFVILMRAKMPAWRGVRFLADTSYSLYLMHGLVGWWVIKVMAPSWPLPLVVALAAAASLASATLSFWLVERPSQKLARRLTRDR
jgi:peptidoglycan/LPS O-acetylase OafA/YrhL